MQASSPGYLPPDNSPASFACSDSFLTEAMKNSVSQSSEPTRQGPGTIPETSVLERGGGLTSDFPRMGQSSSVVNVAEPPGHSDASATCHAPLLQPDASPSPSDISQMDLVDSDAEGILSSDDSSRLGLHEWNEVVTRKRKKANSPRSEWQHNCKQSRKDVGNIPIPHVNTQVTANQNKTFGNY